MKTIEQSIKSMEAPTKNHGTSMKTMDNENHRIFDENPGQIAQSHREPNMNHGKPMKTMEQPVHVKKRWNRGKSIETIEHLERNGKTMKTMEEPVKAINIGKSHRQLLYFE